MLSSGTCIAVSAKVSRSPTWWRASKPAHHCGAAAPLSMPAELLFRPLHAWMGDGGPNPRDMPARMVHSMV